MFCKHGNKADFPIFLKKKRKDFALSFSGLELQVCCQGLRIADFAKLLDSDIKGPSKASVFVEIFRLVGDAQP